MSYLTRIALAELHQRKASVDEAVRMRRFDREAGERLLACWLSIALAAGAAPRECFALVEHWQEDNEYSDSAARAVLLSDGPRRHEYLAELARARNLAAGKARANPTNRALQTRHADLECLAILLGAPSEPESIAQRLAA
ncbi:hypothetical protein K3172_13085 [Qipengyuania sp. 6B39]|uniref:hypothetical protein n=1 Tax=Qipengyuania proteolytica TaxID=2867239 RepID=UPI001C8A4489|nr:hypothetical protein [Qipengyuania proteolytica]MBX7496794.1 hypothetical protein [Qipengyuania proteolytica]